MLGSFRTHIRLPLMNNGKFGPRITMDNNGIEIAPAFVRDLGLLSASLAYEAAHRPLERRKGTV